MPHITLSKGEAITVEFEEFEEFFVVYCDDKVNIELTSGYELDKDVDDDFETESTFIKIYRFKGLDLKARKEYEKLTKGEETDE